jgi:hypothetical protein
MPKQHLQQCQMFLATPLQLSLDLESQLPTSPRAAASLPDTCASLLVVLQVDVQLLQMAQPQQTALMMPLSPPEVALPFLHT